MPSCASTASFAVEPEVIRKDGLVARFGSDIALRICSFLSRVHWVEPKLVAEITYLTWTADNLLRHTVYVRPIRLAISSPKWAAQRA